MAGLGNISLRQSQSAHNFWLKKITLAFDPPQSGMKCKNWRRMDIFVNPILQLDGFQPVKRIDFLLIKRLNLILKKIFFLVILRILKKRKTIFINFPDPLRESYLKIL